MAATETSPTVRRIVGPTIALQGGEYFDFLDPASSRFTIDDIAHALSHICRFTGHCDVFYSVAQHSVHVSRIVPPQHAMGGLLHDAAEAFVGDVSKPLKDLLPDYRIIETRVEQAVLERFGLSLPLPPEIKEADIVMLATEQTQLMRSRDAWSHTHGRQPLDMRLPYMPPKVARQAFLERFYELGGKNA